MSSYGCYKDDYNTNRHKRPSLKKYRYTFSLDIQPLIIKSLSLLLPPIKKNGLDKNLLFDSATYVNFFMNMKSCELRNIKILTSVN